MDATIATNSWGEGRKIVLASSLGAAIEYYDFYLYGSLAGIIAKKFFSGLDPTAAFVFALLAFAAGFLVRPFGAILFGRLGDVVGRKFTFLITVVIIGTATFIVGLLPTYETIGIAAPIILILMRLLQGLALGGEYGGAATYVAEHASKSRRGMYTSWIQATGSFGFLMSLAVIVGLHALIDDNSFDDWGWRVPFLLSIVLVVVSAYIRINMHESPVFQRMREHGETSRAPLTEAFGRWGNLRYVFLALAICIGQAVVWYTGQFYSLFFLTQTLRVDVSHASMMMAVAIAFSMPLFVICGALSDRIGRKWMVVIGLVVAACSYIPLFKALTHFANPALEAAQRSASISVTVDPLDCSFQGNPIATEIDYRSSCDIAKRLLAQSGASYQVKYGPPGTVAVINVGSVALNSFAARVTSDRLSFDSQSKQKISKIKTELANAMRAAGYPKTADSTQINTTMVTVLLFALLTLVAFTFAPLAALLCELFPTRIRYTSMSLPYHLGLGWFGGLLPSVAFALVAEHGDIYSGLRYSISLSIIAAIVGGVFLRERKNLELEKV